jgi:hypothetical protein
MQFVRSDACLMADGAGLIESTCIQACVRSRLRACNKAFVKTFFRALHYASVGEFNLMITNAFEYQSGHASLRKRDPPYVQTCLKSLAYTFSCVGVLASFIIFKRD